MPETVRSIRYFGIHFSVLKTRVGCSESTVRKIRAVVMRYSPHAPTPGERQRYDSAMGDSGIQISDLLVSLSLATDLGFGQPSEHMLRSARIGMRLGERLGLDTNEL